MGKNLIQQKRGKGSPTYKAPTFRAKGEVVILHKKSAVVLDLVKSQFHSAPLAFLKYDDGSTSFVVAVESLRVGQRIEIGDKAGLRVGNIMPLGAVPEGVVVCSIEGVPMDGGKYARSSGSSARVVAKTASGVVVQFSSKKQKTFNPGCYAIIGVAAGGGRVDKPFLKAGNKFKAMKAKNKYWPLVSGASMNAVDHPFGCKRSSRKGRPTIAPKNAPPGRKVGMIRPRGTGRIRGRGRKTK